MMGRDQVDEDIKSFGRKRYFSVTVEQLSLLDVEQKRLELVDTASLIAHCGLEKIRKENRNFFARHFALLTNIFAISEEISPVALMSG